jgi:predicted HTH domain antitoxin
LALGAEWWSSDRVWAHSWAHRAAPFFATSIDARPKCGWRLEAIAVEGYRTGALTEAQVRRLLELDTRFQVHALLKEHHVPLRYSEADLEDDLFTHRELGILPVR